MGDHSLIGASAMSRVIACPASLWAAVDAIAANMAPPSTIHAASGTVAHALAEACLQAGVDPVEEIDAVVYQDNHAVRIDEGMVRSVRTYINTVLTLAASADWHAFETRVCLDSYWRPGEPRPPVSAFGTADALIYHSRARHLDVGDFKHGAGVFVDVTDNPQLLYYAAGALLVVPGPVATIDLVVVQPRAEREGQDKVRTFHTSAIDVLMWVDDVLKPAVARATARNTNYAQGKHCRFCPAVKICPAQHQSRLEQAISDFA